LFIFLLGRVRENDDTRYDNTMGGRRGGSGNEKFGDHVVTKNRWQHMKNNKKGV
jgi:hypothetical protein